MASNSLYFKTTRKLLQNDFGSAFEELGTLFTIITTRTKFPVNQQAVVRGRTQARGNEPEKGDDGRINTILDLSSVAAPPERFLDDRSPSHSSRCCFDG